MMTKKNTNNMEMKKTNVKMMHNEMKKTKK